MSASHGRTFCINLCRKELRLSVHKNSGQNGQVRHEQISETYHFASLRRCFMRDGGRPLEVDLQEEASNRLKLH